MLKRIAMVGVMALLVGTAAIARDDSYGAIAYSRHTGHYGYWHGANSRGVAERRAMEACDRRDCRVEVWFRNSCGALAAGEAGETFGWGHDDSLGEAKEIAMRNCRREGGHRCRVVVSSCAR